MPLQEQEGAKLTGASVALVPALWKEPGSLISLGTITVAKPKSPTKVESAKSRKSDEGIKIVRFGVG
jgi:hypothetical protein